MIKFGESRHLVFRATSPLSRGTLKSKGGWKFTVHFCAVGIRLKLFRTIISVNQLSIYGAVSDLCEEHSSCQTSTGRPVWSEQSDPQFAPANLLVTTPTPSIQIPAQENLLQKYKERVERLPQPDRLVKICTDAGFLKTVEVGQYFMTKPTDEFAQFAEPVTCREYTSPRDEKSTVPKGWLRVNTKSGPVLEVTTSYLQGTYRVDIGIESVNKDNSHLWVIISHGLIKICHRLDRQEVRRQRAGDLYIEDGSICVCKPIKGWIKTENSSHNLLIFKNCTYSWKDMEWYWTKRSIRSSVPSGKKTKHSSSGRRITSRWRWSDRILETERRSSE